MDTCGFRALADRYLEEHQYMSACYWADKQYSVSGGGCVQDLVRLARCLLLTGQSRRAVQLLRDSGLHRIHAECRHLTARALLDTGELPSALELLQPPLDDQQQQSEDEQLSARLWLLRGRVHQAMEDRQQAAECYQRALQQDVTCHEALDALLGHQMLTMEEEIQLMDQLPFDEQLPAATAPVVRALYRLQLKKYTAPQSASADEPSLPAALLTNPDVMTCRAERLYYNCDYANCWRLTCNVLERDADHPVCLPVHMACLVERRNASRLFQLAHQLVERYPEKALSWFAVGAYYYCIGRMDPARRYLNKSTTLSNLFGPAWLVYGHCFAQESEHDQAISAYLSAAQLMRGCHLPLLYVGLEYGLTNNSRLALQFFEQALVAAPGDPFVLHEMGVVAFCGRDYALAERRFGEALRLVQTEWHSVAPQRWEPLFNNLGHTYRKLGRHEEAMRLHQQALLLQPHNASTYSALAFTCALTDRADQAVDLFHKALSLRRDDAFSTQMLANVLEQLLSSQASLQSLDDELPVVVELPSVGSRQLLTQTPTSLVTTTPLDSSNDMSLDIDSDKG